MRIRQSIKNGLVSLARYSGYEVTPLWRLDRQPLARHLRNLFALYDIDCVLDVGGNLGQFYDFLRNEVHYHGLILSFEPVQKYVEILRGRAASEPNWHIFDFALGCVDGASEIHVTKSPGLNSFLEPRKDLVEEFWRDEEVMAKENVQIKRLDDIFHMIVRDFSFQSPYLKLDTQGFDLEVMKGASASLAFIRALQTEASVRGIYQGMPGYRSVLEYLDKMEYDLSGMFPVSHDQDLRLIEFDCVAVNRLFTLKSGPKPSFVV